MKNSYDVVWAERAEKDLQDIVAHIANENPTQALKILNNIKKIHFGFVPSPHAEAHYTGIKRTGDLTIQGVDYSPLESDV
jgi:hypothetical protein